MPPPETQPWSHGCGRVHGNVHGKNYKSTIKNSLLANGGLLEEVLNVTMIKNTVMDKDEPVAAPEESEDSD